jgi:hypothetical protein
MKRICIGMMMRIMKNPALLVLVLLVGSSHAGYLSDLSLLGKWRTSTGENNVGTTSTTSTTSLNSSTMNRPSSISTDQQQQRREGLQQYDNTNQSPLSASGAGRRYVYDKKYGRYVVYHEQEKQHHGNNGGGGGDGGGRGMTTEDYTRVNNNNHKNIDELAREWRALNDEKTNNAAASSWLWSSFTAAPYHTARQEQQQQQQQAPPAAAASVSPPIDGLNHQKAIEDIENLAREWAELNREQHHDSSTTTTSSYKSQQPLLWSKPVTPAGTATIASTTTTSTTSPQKHSPHDANIDIAPPAVVPNNNNNNKQQVLGTPWWPTMQDLAQQWKARNRDPSDKRNIQHRYSSLSSPGSSTSYSVFQKSSTQSNALIPSVIPATAVVVPPSSSSSSSVSTVAAATTTSGTTTPPPLTAADLAREWTARNSDQNRSSSSSSSSRAVVGGLNDEWWATRNSRQYTGGISSPTTTTTTSAFQKKATSTAATAAVFPPVDVASLAREWAAVNRDHNIATPAPNNKQPFKSTPPPDIMPAAAAGSSTSTLSSAHQSDAPMPSVAKATSDVAVSRISTENEIKPPPPPPPRIIDPAVNDVSQESTSAVEVWATKTIQELSSSSADSSTTAKDERLEKEFPAAAGSTSSTTSTLSSTHQSGAPEPSLAKTSDVAVSRISTTNEIKPPPPPLSAPSRIIDTVVNDVSQESSSAVAKAKRVEVWATKTIQELSSSADSSSTAKDERLEIEFQQLAALARELQKVDEEIQKLRRIAAAAKPTSSSVISTMQLAATAVRVDAPPQEKSPFDHNDIARVAVGVGTAAPTEKDVDTVSSIALPKIQNMVTNDVELQQPQQHYVGITDPPADSSNDLPDWVLESLNSELDDEDENIDAKLTVPTNGFIAPPPPPPAVNFEKKNDRITMPTTTTTEDDSTIIAKHPAIKNTNVPGWVLASSVPQFPANNIVPHEDERTNVTFDLPGVIAESCTAATTTPLPEWLLASSVDLDKSSDDVTLPSSSEAASSFAASPALNRKYSASASMTTTSSHSGGGGGGFAPSWVTDPQSSFFKGRDSATVYGWTSPTPLAKDMVTTLPPPVAADPIKITSSDSSNADMGTSTKSHPKSFNGFVLSETLSPPFSHAMRNHQTPPAAGQLTAAAPQSTSSSGNAPAWVTAGSSLPTISSSRKVPAWVSAGTSSSTMSTTSTSHFGGGGGGFAPSWVTDPQSSFFKDRDSPEVYGWASPAPLAKDMAPSLPSPVAADSIKITSIDSSPQSTSSSGIATGSSSSAISSSGNVPAWAPAGSSSSMMNSESKPVQEGWAMPTTPLDNVSDMIASLNNAVINSYFNEEEEFSALSFASPPKAFSRPIDVASPVFASPPKARVNIRGPKVMSEFSTPSSASTSSSSAPSWVTAVNIDDYVDLSLVSVEPDTEPDTTSALTAVEAVTFALTSQGAKEWAARNRNTNCENAQVAALIEELEKLNEESRMWNEENARPIHPLLEQPTKPRRDVTALEATSSSNAARNSRDWAVNRRHHVVGVLPVTTHELRDVTALEAISSASAARGFREWAERNRKDNAGRGSVVAPSILPRDVTFAEAFSFSSAAKLAREWAQWNRKMKSKLNSATSPPVLVSSASTPKSGVPPSYAVTPPMKTTIYHPVEVTPRRASSSKDTGYTSLTAKAFRAWAASRDGTIIDEEGSVATADPEPCDVTVAEAVSFASAAKYARAWAHQLIRKGPASATTGTSSEPAAMGTEPPAEAVGSFAPAAKLISDGASLESTSFSSRDSGEKPSTSYHQDSIVDDAAVSAFFFELSDKLKQRVVESTRPFQADVASATDSIAKTPVLFKAAAVTEISTAIKLEPVAAIAKKMEKYMLESPKARTLPRNNGASYPPNLLKDQGETKRAIMASGIASMFAATIATETLLERTVPAMLARTEMAFTTMPLEIHVRNTEEKSSEKKEKSITNPSASSFFGEFTNRGIFVPRQWGSRFNTGIIADSNTQRSLASEKRETKRVQSSVLPKADKVEEKAFVPRLRHEGTLWD